AEHGKIAVHGLARERELQRVTLGQDVLAPALAVDLAVALGRDVPTTRQAHAGEVGRDAVARLEHDDLRARVAQHAQVPLARGEVPRGPRGGNGEGDARTRHRLNASEGAR